MGDKTGAAVGQRLRKALKQINITQAQLAEELGMSQQVISQRISGETPIGDKVAIHLATRYGINLQWLYTGCSISTVGRGGPYRGDLDSFQELEDTELLQELSARLRRQREVAPTPVPVVRTTAEVPEECDPGAGFHSAVPYTKGLHGIVKDSIPQEDVAGVFVIHRSKITDMSMLRCAQIQGFHLGPLLPHGSIIGVDKSRTDMERLNGTAACIWTEPGNPETLKIRFVLHWPEEDTVEFGPGSEGEFEVPREVVSVEEAESGMIVGQVVWAFHRMDVIEVT